MYKWITDMSIVSICYLVAYKHFQNFRQLDFYSSFKCAITWSWRESGIIAFFQSFYPLYHGEIILVPGCSGRRIYFLLPMVLWQQSHFPCGIVDHLKHLMVGMTTIFEDSACLADTMVLFGKKGSRHDDTFVCQGNTLFTLCLPHTHTFRQSNGSQSLQTKAI